MDVRDISGRITRGVVAFLGGVAGTVLAMWITSAIRLRRGDPGLTILIGFFVGGAVAGIAHEILSRRGTKIPRAIARRRLL
jgi:hypothetical protein